MNLSKRVSNLKPSATLALNQKAKELAQAGESIVNLTAGEPDFSTPERIRKAAIEAIHRGETFYTPAAGIPDLRKAVAEKTNREYGRDYVMGDVVISNGGKQALFNLCQALLSDGDEAVILAPYWVSYTSLVELAGGTPVVIQTEEKENFAPEIRKVERALNEKTRILFVNSPSNPTGALYSRQTLEALARLASKWPNLVVVTDDIYEKLIFEGQRFVSIGMLKELSQEQLVIASGVSKTYAMTGWRIGYAIGPKKIMKAVSSLQSQSTSNAASISQWAALEAIQGDQSDVREMVSVFEKRRNLIHEQITSIDRVTCQKPGGAFYIFPNFSAYLGSKTSEGNVLGTDVELASHLLEVGGVATVPGSAFGAPGHLRLSYGADEETLLEGCRRISSTLMKLQRNSAN